MLINDPYSHLQHSIIRVNVQKNQLFPYKVYRIETWHGNRSCKTTFQNFFFNKKFQGFQPFQARLTANF